MSSEALATILFIVVVAITIGITFWASRNTKSAADYYAGGRNFSGFQNGLAISGDYMSAASFLGISGAIALSGYDGFLYSIGFLVAWLIALLLVAELLRNSGRYTMADQLAYRMRQRPVRTAAATSTVVVSIFYLLAQMVGAGALVTLLLGIDGEWAIRFTIIAVGLLMIFYVVVGGMKGTTWVQIVKAVLLMTGTILITVLVLAEFNFNISDLLGAAASNSGKGDAFLEPGLKYGIDTTSRIDFLSLGLALVLGTAGLPHILIRFYTVPTAKDARTSVNWAITLIGAFYLMTLVLGFGAAALLNVGPESDVATSGGNLASPLLAEEVGGGAGSNGGAILLAFIAAVAFATILAVVAGLTLTSASSVAHDLYANVIKKGTASREGRGEGGTDRGVRDRWRRHRAVDLRPGSEHRVPGGARLRGRCLGQPASAGDEPLLEAVQHPRRDVGHLRRSHHLRRPGVLLTDGVRSDRCLLDLGRLLVVPAGQPGHHLDPGRLPVRHPRHAHLA